MESIDRLNGLYSRFRDLAKPLRVARYNTADNREEEKSRLLEAYEKQVVYNPQFVYPEFPAGCGLPLLELLRELRPDQSAWERIIADEVIDTLAELNIAEYHNPEDITSRSLNLYGPVTEDLEEAARATLRQLTSAPAERTITAAEVANHVREGIVRAGLEDWKISIDESMNARISVRPTQQEVRIREDALFTANDRDRLLVHEIGTHAFRAENGKLQPLKLLRSGLTNYIMTEEGLATYHEDKFGVQNNDDMRRYALRVIAAHLSLSQPFYNVFCEIVEHVDVHEAFDIVVRAKRGFTDTSIVGAHLKDKVYFEGFQRVTKHLQRRPEDYELLMSGKASLEMIPLLFHLRETNQLVAPRYLPEMLVNR